MFSKDVQTKSASCVTPLYLWNMVVRKQILKLLLVIYAGTVMENIMSIYQENFAVFAPLTLFVAGKYNDK